MDSTPTPPAGRTLLGGVLMGLANLVPGISGGTMILAVGLYDAFIGAVADVSRLRLRRQSLVFLGIVALGLGLAVVTLSGVAVSLVSGHRWIMYSLFIGLTLGGAPALWKECKPLGPAPIIAFLIGAGAMALLAFGSLGANLGSGPVTLAIVGAAAASSMILPGVSGSYVLLVLGLYDLVIGSLSASELRADPSGSAAILVPVIIGAVVGIALLANLLKALLARFRAPSHGALLGLLCGSVFGLYPFQESTYSELASRDSRKAIEAVVVKEQAIDEVAKEREVDVEELRTWTAAHAGLTKGELKSRSLETGYFKPGGGQIAAALGLLLAGILATQALSRLGAKEE